MLLYYLDFQVSPRLYLEQKFP